MSRVTSGDEYGSKVNDLNFGLSKNSIFHPRKKLIYVYHTNIPLCVINKNLSMGVPMRGIFQFPSGVTMVTVSLNYHIFFAGEIKKQL